MYILKTNNESGIPSYWDINDFQQKYQVNVNKCDRISVKFKRGKRRKIKRLHIKVTTYPCELCGQHSHATGRVGGKEFSIELL